jgi:hypothetical protein
MIPVSDSVLNFGIDEFSIIANVTVHIFRMPLEQLAPIRQFLRLMRMPPETPLWFSGLYG